MAYYQNIFTQVQLRSAEPEPGVCDLELPRLGKGGFNYWLGRIGNAQISERHTNFIVNLGDASAQDVLGLIIHIRRTIKQKLNIVLEPEVKLLGFPENVVKGLAS